MANANGATSVQIPARYMAEYVRPRQQQVLEATGLHVSPAKIVIKLMELGHAVDMEKDSCTMSGTSN